MTAEAEGHGGDSTKEDEKLRVGKSGDDLEEDVEDEDDDNVRGGLRDSLLSVSHAVYDVSETGLVPDLRYSGR